MTRRRIFTSIGTGLVTVALAGGTAVALQPGVAAAGDYGQHVRQCAQEHGFDGSHNPGMHRGASGWHHEEC
jgi:hypothetical protein